MNKLVIAEKPSVALRLALSLGDSQPKRFNVNEVGYFEVQKGNDVLFIVAAAGHLFTLHQRDKTKNTLPIFDIEWIPSYKVNKDAYFTKRYLDTIEQIAKRCTFFINACDYDLEGSVIGTNIIKTVVNKDVNTELKSGQLGRMRFSTTTKPDLEYAYENMVEFDFSNFDAGEARHELDWMWGINMSRALMNALYANGMKKVMSIGRVQGPTLGILAKRDVEIRNFVSAPFWKLFAKIEGTEFENRKGNIEKKEVAEESLEKTKSGKGVVTAFDEKEEMHAPFPPFDLTSLQLEASRAFRIDPSRTLAIAQALYERSYISYPRTSSQKLPPTLNLKRVITMLGESESYSELAKELIAKSRFRPHEGIKVDEAHPAIYPTGEKPKTMSTEEAKIYDLIVKRFLSCFAEYAKGQRRSATIGVNGEEYYATGETITEKGWLKFYEQYYKPKELEIPRFAKGAPIKIDDAYMKEGKTEPPKRYTKAALIGLLEKKNLGTKATRAAIIDTLLNRGYIQNSKLEVTSFGMSVYEALSKYCPEITEEEMTKKLEDDLEEITKGKIKKEKVVEEGKEILTKIIKEFAVNGKEIGQALGKGLQDSEKADILGLCPKCGGNLSIRKSRIGKQFVGCSNWPKCSNGYPLPQYAKVVPLNKVCELCKSPKIKVFSKGKVFEMCLDPNCESKKDWNSKAKTEEGPAVVKAIELKKAAEGKVKSKGTKAEAKPKKDAPAKRKAARKKPEENT